MKTNKIITCIVASAWFIARAVANLILDPIADYLSMQVPDRSDYVGTLDHVDRVKVDIDGDGKDEVFVGTPYKYSGSMEVFWAGYRLVDRDYQRITPANEDITVGSFEIIYVGALPEIAKQGLAIADDIEVDIPQSGNVTRVGTLRFYYLMNGQLVVEERGALELAVPADKAAYERYFGEDRVTRKATIESFTREQLQQMGYTIPNWELSPP